MIYHSKDIMTGADGRTWLIDHTGRGRNERLYLLSDGTYASVADVIKITKLPAATVRLRLYKSDRPEVIFAKRHDKKSEWKTHHKLKNKKQKIDDPMVRLLLSFK